MKSVLVVEDEPFVLDVVASMVEVMGYRVISANSGEAAMQMLRESEVDLLLADVLMHPMSGDVLAREALRLRPDIAVVFVSGYAPEMLPDLPEGCLFLQKPFKLAQLQDALVQALNSLRKEPEEIS